MERSFLNSISECCLVKKSVLPVYYHRVPGNINDVSTLHNLMLTFKALRVKGFHYVMDKGFYSKKNIDALVGNRDHFTISVPLNNGYSMPWMTFGTSFTALTGIGSLTTRFSLCSLAHLPLGRGKASLLPSPLLQRHHPCQVCGRIQRGATPIQTGD